MVAQVLVIVGCVFILIAAVGSLKFPDTLTRMAAISKSSTLGIALICAGGCVEFGWTEASAQLLAAMTFMFVAIPLASHLLGRSRIQSKKALWEGTQRNDYETKSSV